MRKKITTTLSTRLLTACGVVIAILVFFGVWMNQHGLPSEMASVYCTSFLVERGDDYDCLMKHALLRKDPSHCEFAVSGRMNLYCFDQFKELLDDPEQCDLFENPTLQMDCYIALATKTRDKTVCTSFTDVVLVERCARAVAGILVDTDFCDLVADNQTREECYSDIAVGGYQTSICDEIQSEYLHGLCYTNIAVDLKDEGVCRMIGTQLGEDLCFGKLAILLRQPDFCAEIIDSGEQSTCYRSLAELLEDQRLCSFVTDAGQRESCLQIFGLVDQGPFSCERVSDYPIAYWGCNLAMAVTKQDDSYCDRSESESERERCVELVADKAEDARQCELDGNSGSSKLACVSFFEDDPVIYSCETSDDQFCSLDWRLSSSMFFSACQRDQGYQYICTYFECRGWGCLYREDFFLCEETEGDRRQKCLPLIARAEEDVELCLQLPDDNQIYRCVIDVAGYRKEGDLCERLPEDSRKPCFREVARVTGDIQLCLKLSPYQDECVQDAVRGADDLSDCDVISDVQQQIYCRRSINYRLKLRASCELTSDPDLKAYCYEYYSG